MRLNASVIIAMKKHFAKIKIEDKCLDLATKLLNENGIEIY